MDTIRCTICKGDCECADRPATRLYKRLVGDPPRDIRRARWRTAGIALDIVLTLALLADLAVHWHCRQQPPAPARCRAGGRAVIPDGLDELDGLPLALAALRDKYAAESAAAIVRALAAADPWVQTEAHLHVCGLCGVACPGELDVPHSASCPARLAREWVAALLPAEQR